MDMLLVSSRKRKIGQVDSEEQDVEKLQDLEAIWEKEFVDDDIESEACSQRAKPLDATDDDFYCYTRSTSSINAI